MIDALRRLLRRLAALAALIVGALLAALFAALMLAAALAIGAALWLAGRFGLRATRRAPGPAAPRGADASDVIDVEMREIAPGDEQPAARSEPPRPPT